MVIDRTKVADINTSFRYCTCYSVTYRGSRQSTGGYNYCTYGPTCTLPWEGIDTAYAALPTLSQWTVQIVHKSLPTLPLGKVQGGHMTLHALTHERVKVLHIRTCLYFPMGGCRQQVYGTAKRFTPHRTPLALALLGPVSWCRYVSHQRGET